MEIGEWHSLTLRYTNENNQVKEEPRGMSVVPRATRSLVGNSLPAVCVNGMEANGLIGWYTWRTHR